MRRPLVFLMGCAALSVFAADPVAFADVRAVLEEFAGQMPAGLAANEASWQAWSVQHDRDIRARLKQGELDSMVNLLLYGTSFTSQPRISMATLAGQTRAGVLRARVDDLLRGLRTPGNSARLRLVGELLAGEVLDPGSPAAGTFMLANLQRVLEETTRFNQRMAEAKSDAQVFRDRGVSVDTGILPNFAIETALRRMQERGLLRSGEIARAAVIGPGLDFTDKESGYDFYPLQTLQPFALYNTLMRLGVARPSITVFDISPRVLDHLRAARGGSYTVQLPRDSSAAWNPEAIAYWRSFGDQAGESVEPIAPPPLLPMVTTRAVRFPREVVDGIATEDLNIVVGRLRGASFDLIVATNILVYYDAFEQALALANIAAMLKPGGFLLTNDALPEARSVPMRLLERTAVNYVAQPRSGDTVYWYQRQRSGVY